MLHSEDADISKVLRQVIELDKRAERIKSNVMERAEEILEQTKKRIIDKEKVELDQVQEEEKNNYQNEIAKAKDESLLIIDSMKQDIGKLQCRYNEMKDQKATEFLDDLFKT
ncbi:hypothetical protein [Acetobacterium sp.]|uniref:hypothetical protein n=1 Tax=Acetobacterium sp. TaxID=1872094 RepID=UPI002F425B39